MDTPAPHAGDQPAPARDRPAPPASWDPPEAEPSARDEVRNVRRLLRAMSLFVLWPAATAAAALLLADDDAHGRGFAAYFVLATILGAALYLAAPRLAQAWVARERLK